MITLSYNWLRITDLWKYESKAHNRDRSSENKPKQQPLSKEVTVYDSFAQEYFTFPSFMACERAIGCSTTSIKKLAGFSYNSIGDKRYFRTKEDYESMRDRTIVILDTQTGNELCFATMADCARALDCAIQSVFQLVKGRYQFIQKRYRLVKEL